jgi:hypothetical protein
MLQSVDICLAQTIPNANFENWTAGNLDDWNTVPDGTDDVSFQQAVDEGVTGDALKIITGITAGHIYDLNIKVKGDNKIWIRYWDTRWYNDSNVQVGSDIDEGSYSSGLTTSSWSDYGVSNQTAPAEATKLKINFRIYIQSGFTVDTSYILVDDMTVTDLHVGDLVINEIMYDPSTSQPDTEWFEVKNVSGRTLDINSCTISDADNNSHMISGASNVNDGDYYIFGASSSITGVTVDYTYGTGIPLANTTPGDTIKISCGSTLIDEVSYDVGAND